MRPIAVLTIRAGDEITAEYRLSGAFPKPWPCLCGSANCPGYVVGDFFSLDRSEGGLINNIRARPLRFRRTRRTVTS